MNLSVCADMIFKNFDYTKRIEKIKECGINAVEFWNWSDKNLTSIRETIKSLDMKISTFCVDSKNNKISNFIRKNALNTKDCATLLKSFDESSQIAKMFGTDRLIITVGDYTDDAPHNNQKENIYNNLCRLAEKAQKNNITVLIESINLSERPNYIFPDVRSIIEIVKKISCENIKVLYDIYHQAAGNMFYIEEMIRDIEFIGHIHVADFPGRGEIGSGNIDYIKTFSELKKHGYNNYIGLEYMASKDEEKTVKNAFEIINH